MDCHVRDSGDDDFVIKSMRREASVLLLSELKKVVKLETDVSGHRGYYTLRTTPFSIIYGDSIDQISSALNFLYRSSISEPQRQAINNIRRAFEQCNDVHEGSIIDIENPFD